MPLSVVEMLRGRVDLKFVDPEEIRVLEHLVDSGLGGESDAALVRLWERHANRVTVVHEAQGVADGRVAVPCS